MSKKIELRILEEVTVPIALDVFTKGLTVHKLQLDTAAVAHDIVPGPYDEEDVPTKYVNTIIGRYSNRVPVSSEGHTINKGGHTNNVKPIANEGKEVSLHGGPSTLDSTEWEHIPTSSSKLFTPSELESLATLESDRDFHSSAVFAATSPNGHNGFPGTLYLEALFAVLPRASTPDPSAPEYQLGQILIVYRAKLLESGIVSPVNLTQHWGFNLEASIRGAPHLNIRDHYATVNADHYVRVDERFLPDGNLVATAGTGHCHQGKKIGDQFPEGGYDHFYLFRKEIYEAVTKTQPASFPANNTDINLLGELLDRSPPSAEKLQVELWSEKTGFRLQFISNQGGVQFYTANSQTDGTRKKIHGGSGEKGDRYPKEASVFLEFHNPLSAFLHPQNGIDTLLTSDEVYHNYVKVNVHYRKPNRDA